MTISIERTTYPDGSTVKRNGVLQVVKPEDRPAPDTKEFNKVWARVPKEIKKLSKTK